MGRIALESVAILQTPTAAMDMAKLGGLEQVELQELRGLQSHGVRTTLSVAKLVGEHDAVRVVHDLGANNRLLKYYYYWAFAGANRAANVFHGHYTPQLGLLFPRKSVLHYHGHAVAELPLYRYARARFSECHYVFCAAWVRDRFWSRYPELPEDHMHVVYNGADVDAFTPSGHAPLGTPNLVFYGGWSEPKGVLVLAEVARLLLDSGAAFTLHFGGSAHSHYAKVVDASALDVRVREACGASADILFPGWIQHNDLPGFLRGKHIGLFPSIYEDPFPLVPLEMMAAGLPVVAFDIGGAREAVVHGETGFLVRAGDRRAFADAVRTLIASPSLRAEMGRAARAHVEQHFTWDRHVDQLLTIYEQIVKRNRDRGC